MTRKGARGMHWTDELVRLGACGGAVEWAKQFPDLQSAWDACERGAWMLWYARAIGSGWEEAAWSAWKRRERERREYVSLPDIAREFCPVAPTLGGQQ